MGTSLTSRLQRIVQQWEGGGGVAKRGGSRPGFHGEGAVRDNWTSEGKHPGILQTEKCQWDATVLDVWGPSYEDAKSMGATKLSQ